MQQRSKALVWAVSILLGLSFTAVGEYQGFPLPEEGHYHPNAYTGEVGGLDVWSFPILPGTIEWGSAEEEVKNQSMVMPPSVLQSISTKGLAWTCIKNPWRMNWIFHNSQKLPTCRPSDDWRFNGCIELFGRADVGVTLLEMYSTFIDLSYRPSYLDSSIVSEGAMWFFINDISLLEMWLARSDVLSQLDQSQLSNLLCLAQIRDVRVADSFCGKDARAALLGNVLLRMEDPRVGEISGNLLESHRSFILNPGFSRKGLGGSGYEELSSCAQTITRLLGQECGQESKSTH